MFLIRNSLLFLFKHRFSRSNRNRWHESRLRPIIVENTTTRVADVEMSFSLRLESGVTVPRDGNAISGNSRLRSDGVSPFTRVKKNKFRFYCVCYYLRWYSIAASKFRIQVLRSSCRFSGILTRDIILFFLKNDPDAIVNCTIACMRLFSVHSWSSSTKPLLAVLTHDSFLNCRDF